MAGIALATGLTGWLQFVAHIRALKDHPVAQFDDGFKRAVPRIVLSTLVMAGLLYGAAFVLAPWIAGSLLQQIAAILALVLGGMIVYGLAVFGTGVVRPADVKKYLVKNRIKNLIK